MKTPLVGEYLIDTHHHDYREKLVERWNLKVIAWTSTEVDSVMVPVFLSMLDVIRRSHAPRDHYLNKMMIYLGNGRAVALYDGEYFRTYELAPAGRR